MRFWNRLCFLPSRDFFSSSPHKACSQSFPCRPTMDASTQHIKRASSSSPRNANVSAAAVAALRDFSRSLPATYREGYSQWRRGSSKGAKGEGICMRLKPVVQPSPLDPWAENWHSPHISRRVAAKALPISSSPRSWTQSPICGPTPADPWDELDATFALQTTPASSTCSPR